MSDRVVLSALEKSMHESSWRNSVVGYSSLILLEVCQQFSLSILSGETYMWLYYGGRQTKRRT